MTYLKYIWKWLPLNIFIHFKELAYEDYIIKLAESRATLDIPTFGQKNVTTRPIEALATRTKIITTNNLIKKYDFFCDDNVFIIEKDYSIEKLKEWLDRPYKDVDYNILRKYELSEWAKDVIL